MRCTILLFMFNCYVMTCIVLCQVQTNDTIHLTCSRWLKWQRKNQLLPNRRYNQRNKILAIPNLSDPIISRNYRLNGILPGYSKTFTEVLQPDGTIQFQPIHNNNSSLNLSFSQSIAATGGLFLVPHNCSALMILTGRILCTMVFHMVSVTASRYSSSIS